MKKDHAAALQYHESEQLPRVIASGAGEVARQILRIAEEHDIPVYQDEALSQLLQHLPQGAEVPKEAYQVVAEVLCFLYALDQERARS